MRVSGYPYWGVRVKPGDALRSNVTYDTKIQSTYENMGIAVALLAPDENGKPTARGVNPFKAPIDRSKRCKSGGLTADKPTLCNQGDNYGAPGDAWKATTGQQTNGVNIANFLYTPGDLTTIEMTGVPTVKYGETLNFTNLEGTTIYHTVTSCAFPCAGTTGVAFPLADGETSSGGKVDFDSSELGVGAPVIGPAKQELSWGLPVTSEEGFKPGDLVTYYCRIHPGMRGAFEVSE
jgi:plastocyanin